MGILPQDSVALDMRPKPSADSRCGQNHSVRESEQFSRFALNEVVGVDVSAYPSFLRPAFECLWCFHVSPRRTARIVLGETFRSLAQCPAELRQ